MSSSIRQIVNKAEIARHLGISQSYVAKILAGQRKSAKYTRLIHELLQRELIRAQKAA